MYISDCETYFEYEGMFMMVAGYIVDKQIVEGVEEGAEVNADAEVYQVEIVDGKYEFIFYGVVPAKIKKDKRKWELKKIELD